jgi:hypothetical protein
MKRGSRIWTSGPIASAYTTVPTPTDPPSSQDHHFDESPGHPDRPSGAPGQAGHESVPGTGAEACADVAGGRDRVQDHGATEHRDLPAEVGKLRNERQADVREHTHQNGVAQRAESGPLLQRNPQQEHQEADDDHHNADAQSRPARNALVEHVPWVKAEPGADEQGQGNAVHGKAGEELEESASHH